MAEEQREKERLAEEAREKERLAEEVREKERLAEEAREKERLAEEQREKERLAEEERSKAEAEKEDEVQDINFDDSSDFDMSEVSLFSLVLPLHCTCEHFYAQAALTVVLVVAAVFLHETIIFLSRIQWVEVKRRS